MQKKAILALASGQIFRGTSIGATGITVGELVFNTSMTGYQEMLTDPSYAKQIITLTYPHIGNVGINADDRESQQVWAAGLVIRDLTLTTSNWRAEHPLTYYLQQQGVVTIAGLDTRQLTRILRDQGALNACIMAGEIDEQTALASARDFSGLNDLDLACLVSTEKPYEWRQGGWDWKINAYPQRPIEELPRHLVVYDFGVKHSILRKLVDRGCRLTVVPATTSAKAALRYEPDGIVLSNGPGDPAACDYAIAATREFLQSDVPLLGICLGHQLLALACGAKTVKMKFGHHGTNHPVEDLTGNRVFITSQNHGFSVDEQSLPDTLKVTHRSLFDGSIQGVKLVGKSVFSFQGHPEAGPGPQEMDVLFDQFIACLSS